MAEHTESQPEKKVLVAVDGSDHADYALDWYIKELKRPEDRIVLLYIPDSYDFSLTSKAMYEELKADIDKRVKQMEEKYGKKMKEMNVTNVKFRSMAGKPEVVIVEAAKDENANLVVTGTRGLGKLRRTFLGSVSNYVLHHCHCPVLVCCRKYN